MENALLSLLLISNWRHCRDYIAKIHHKLQNLQCRHLIPALNARSVRPQNTLAHPIGTELSGVECDHSSLTSQLNVTLIHKLRGSMMYLAFLTCYSWEVHNQALADVRSTGVEIKCLYCRLCILFYLFPINPIYLHETCYTFSMSYCPSTSLVNATF